MITDTTQKTTVQLFRDNILWVDEFVAGKSAADRWRNVLTFYQERHGKPYVVAMIKDFLSSYEGKQMLTDHMRENGN